MVKFAICDDSVEFQRVFKNAINVFCNQLFQSSVDFSVVNCFGSGEEVLDYLKFDDIDYIFLDIDMPGINGFELAKRLLWKHEKLGIVFVSAYDQFVYESFEFAPFAFLRKDCIMEELPKILKRIAEHFENDCRKVEISSLCGKKTLYTKDILFVSSKGNYYVYNMKDGNAIECRGAISKTEGLLAKFGFYQIHSAYIVNMKYIQKIENGFVYMGLDNQKLPIAQRRLSGFRHAYAEYNLRSLKI